MKRDVNQILIPYLPALLTIVAIVLGSMYNKRRIDDLKDLFKAEIGRLEGVMNARFALVDARFDRIEDRLDRVEHRLEGIERRVSHLDEQRLIR
jgi:hypothetical protein